MLKKLSWVLVVLFIFGSGITAGLIINSDALAGSGCKTIRWIACFDNYVDFAIEVPAKVTHIKRHQFNLKGNQIEIAIWFNQ